jgi:minichromosome maintenance protein 10
MGVGSSSQKHKASYDPQRKWGLSPAEGTPAPSADATYIVAGHVVAGSGAGKRDLFLSESVGREAQARAARQANSRDTDAALKRLLKRDKEGMKAVQAARDFAKHARDKEAKKALGKDVKLSLLEKRGRRRKGEEEDGDDDDDEDDVSDDGGSASNTENDDSDGIAADADRSTKNAYSARVIKELGFDPTRGRHKRKGDDDSQNLCSKVRPSFRYH